MTLINRLCGAVAALAVTLQFSANAEAGAPQQKTQAPGYYRLILGEFEVTALSDGTFLMDAGKILTNVTPKELDAGLARSFLKNPVETSVNGFLVNTGPTPVPAPCSDLRSANCCRISRRRAIGRSKWTKFTYLTCTAITWADCRRTANPFFPMPSCVPPSRKPTSG